MAQASLASPFLARARPMPSLAPACSLTCAATRSNTASRRQRPGHTRVVSSAEAPKGRSAPIRKTRSEQEPETRGRSQASSLLSNALVLSSVTALSTSAVVQPANALEAKDIVESLEKVEVFAQKTGDFLLKLFDVGKATVEVLVQLSKPVIEAATPVVQEATKSAINAAAPVVVDTTGKAAKFLEDQGLDLGPVVQAGKVAADATTTVVTEAGVYGDKAGKALQVLAPAWQFLSSQSPSVLAAESGALFLLYLAAPFVFSSLIYSIRGFAGTITPAQALDNLIKGNWTLVDVRTEKEKGEAGIPSLPRGAKNRLIFVPLEEVPDSLKGQLKSARALECELTAIKIAAHKKLSKNSRVIILDQRGDVAKRVARSLASCGVRNAYAIQDGMEGSNGWVNNALAVDFYEAKAEYLSPASVLSGSRVSRSGEEGEKGGTTRLREPGPGLLRRMGSSLALPSGRTEEEE